MCSSDLEQDLAVAAVVVVLIATATRIPLVIILRLTVVFVNIEPKNLTAPELSLIRELRHHFRDFFPTPM